MGKVTVKHYLNTKIQPEIINNENYYPVYIQITINRKTTQYRSISLQKLSEKDFDNYIKGNDYNANFDKHGIESKEYFEKEPERIQKAFEFIIKVYKFESFKESDKGVFDIMWGWISGLFLLWTDNALITSTWNYLIDIDNTKEKFYNPFNKDISLVESINDLNKSFGVDIKDKIPKDDLELWNNIRLIIRNLKKWSVYIDFVCNYKTEIDNTKGIANKEKFKEAMKYIIENFVYLS